MNTEEMVNIASIIYMDYAKEELKDNKKPRLIYNIAKIVAGIKFV